MKKLVYTFFNYNKKTSRALYDSTLEGWDKKYVNGRNINPLIKSVPQYDIIVGIADHNKNAQQIRFDPRYVNKHGRRTLIEGAKEEYLSYSQMDLWGIIRRTYREYRIINNA